MSQSVLAIAEQLEGVFRKVTFEALSEGRRIADQLGGELNALVLGDNIENISKELEPFGADRIIVAEDPALFEYLPDAYVNVIADVINKETPDVVILGASAQGKDIAARLSARLNAPLAMDCVAIRFEDNNLMATRYMYGGKILADVMLNGKPKILAIRPNAMTIARAAGTGQLKSVRSILARHLLNSLKSILIPLKLNSPKQIRSCPGEEEWAVLILPL